MVGKNIKAFREQKNLTQEQLAEQLNVTRQAVSSWENEKTQPDVETLHKIACALECSVEELIYGERRKFTIVNNINKKTVTEGLSFGSALAIVISYVEWKSIGWAILHGLFGWVYVIYYVIRYLL
ncbi:MAG: helix-turn-helix transcriptional regulator [Clostridia bacterium]|nr:helix-turn-helix transcriptional regulator [Clostridia bacterium]MBR4054301.1 helix-turn-helix transcriptional regulator [Clostridia bacterium]